MTTEHALRAMLTVYVEDEVRYREGIAALDNLLARLRTVEAERNEARESLRIADEAAGREHTNRVLAENDRDLKAELMERYVDDLAAAEARVEALQPFLKHRHGCAAPATAGGMFAPGPCTCGLAALACFREKTTMTARDESRSAPKSRVMSAGYLPAVEVPSSVLVDRITVAMTMPHNLPGVAGRADGDGCARCNAEHALQALFGRAEDHIDFTPRVYDLSDMSEYELAYLTNGPCTCTRGHVTGDSLDAYTCFAHRAQAELDRRAALSPGARP